MLKNKILAVDFDGTLSFGEYPECGKPNTKLIEWLKECQKNGCKLILWTMREGKPLEDAVEWCKGYGLEFDAVNENLPELIEKYGDKRKIFADHYLDSSNIIPDYAIRNLEEEKRKRVARII